MSAVPAVRFAPSARRASLCASPVEFVADRGTMIDPRKGGAGVRGLLGEFELDGRLSSHGPVANKPYQAEVEEVHTRYSPTQSARAYGTQWRDGRGSVRTDAVYPDPLDPARTLKLTTIFDAVTGTIRLLSEQSRADHTFRLPRSADELQALLRSRRETPAAAACPAMVSPTQHPRFESLGERTIEGVTCAGYRSRNESAGPVCEHWWSKELVIGLIYKARDPDGETAFRMFNLRLREPDASLFLAGGEDIVF